MEVTGTRKILEKGNVQKGVTRSKDHTRTKVDTGTIVQKRYFYKGGTERRYLQ